ncbi:MAG TPA: RNA polymerase sporulation sigma factor SigH [Clostridia bacterium]|nr:RNA polymerase sporulation sigma factor SigH [Clostridia bacterium]
MSDMTDEQLTELTKQHDEAAAEELYHRYFGLVYARARAYYLIGAEQKDLIQEGMVGLFKAVNDYSAERGAFRSFADRCITRQMLTAIKSATRKKHGPLNSYISFSRPPVDGELQRSLEEVLTDMYNIDPEDTVIKREALNTVLMRVENELSTYEKQVLQLFVGGSSYAEIAQKLHRSQKSVDNALQRIKHKLGKPD